MSDQPLDTTERLEAALYQYVNLYERWSEDRQVFSKKGADLSRLIESISDEVSRLESIDDSVRKSLAHLLQQVVSVVKKQIANIATDEVKQGLWEATQQLKRVVNDTDESLRRSRWEVRKSRWQWFGITVSAAVLSSVLFVWWALPDNLYQLNPHQVVLMDAGSNFLELLAHSSKKEQDRLFDKLKTIKEDQLTH